MQVHLNDVSVGIQSVNHVSHIFAFASYSQTLHITGLIGQIIHCNQVQTGNAP